MTAADQQPLTDLRALAEAATPGPWIHGEETEHWSRTYRVPIGPGLIAGATKPADAAYIAAVDPQTILALLDANAALREQLAAARAAIPVALDWFEKADREQRPSSDHELAGAEA